MKGRMLNRMGKAGVRQELADFSCCGECTSGACCAWTINDVQISEAVDIVDGFPALVQRVKDKILQKASKPMGYNDERCAFQDPLTKGCLIYADAPWTCATFFMHRLDNPDCCSCKQMGDPNGIGVMYLRTFQERMRKREAKRSKGLDIEYGSSEKELHQAIVRVLASRGDVECREWVTKEDVWDDLKVATEPNSALPVTTKIADPPSASPRNQCSGERTAAVSGNP